MFSVSFSSYSLATLVFRSGQMSVRYEFVTVAPIASIATQPSQACNIYYLAGTNKLAAVNNPAGTAVLDYDYDATGQLTRQRDEKGPRYLTYDVAGKVTGMYRDQAHQQPLVAFAYDDRGFRTRKASYDPTTFQLKQTTYSVRDAAGNELSTYTQDATLAGSPLVRSEVPLYGASRLGTRTRLDDGSEDYRYELNDQLGNARVLAM